MSREAWKDTGDCSECRRIKYCQRQCTANKRRAERMFKAFWARGITGIMNTNFLVVGTKDHQDAVDARNYAAEELKRRSE